MNERGATEDAGGRAEQRSWGVGVLGRLIGLTLLWWVLAEGDVTTWRYAVVIVPVATGVSLLTVPPRPWRGSPLRRGLATLQLLWWFAHQSWRGGWDVARRALRQPVRIDPVDLTVPLSLRSRRARVTLAAIASLTPGSLTVDLAPRDPATGTPSTADTGVDVGATHDLLLHVLHQELEVAPMIAELESLIARMWGER